MARTHIKNCGPTRGRRKVRKMGMQSGKLRKTLSAKRRV